jgi:hypothetical protein
VSLLLGCTPPAQDVVRNDTEADESASTSTATGTLDDTTTSSSMDGSESGSGGEDDDADETTGTQPPEVDCNDFGGHVIYVNFDGPTLTPGEEDDARVDVTVIGDLAIELAPYEASDAHKLEIVGRVDDLYQDFDVCVTRTRPVTGDYTMAVVTPTNPFGGSVFGIAGPDCGNANPNNIVFAFFEPTGRFQASSIGTVIAGNLGHSYGLDQHASDRDDDVMHAGNFLYASSFKDTCITPLHNQQCDHFVCDHPGQQNSWRELLETLGPRRP